MGKQGTKLAKHEFHTVRIAWFLVWISSIFISGRGLEVIASNVRNSSTVSLVLFKLDLMTSVDSGVHVLVVHYCISLIIHRLKEHTVIFIKNGS